MHTRENFDVNLPIKRFDICICVLVCMHTHTYIYIHAYLYINTDTFSPIPLDRLGEESDWLFYFDVILSLLPHLDQDR